ncbi:MAG: GtrA family protein [Deltaproteobacteria bacterium]|nr:GtrA family protein [Deltaproteobacteria bacterium]
MRLVLAQNAAKLARARIIKFGVVGVSGVAVNLLIAGAVSDLMVREGFSIGGATPAALVAGITVSIFTNFLFNDGWTWADQRGRDPWLVRCRKFYLTSAGAALLQWATSLLIHHFYLPNEGFWFMSADALRLKVAACVAILVAMPVNFLVNHFWTFRRAKN